MSSDYEICEVTCRNGGVKHCFLSMNYVEFGFCIILSHRWFILGWFSLLASMILDVKDKGFCSFVCVTLSALITEITVALKLPDGIK